MVKSSYFAHKLVPNFWANLSLFGPYKGLFSKGIRPDNTGNECIFVGCNDKANSTQSTTIKGFCEDSKFEMLEATFTLMHMNRNNVIELFSTFLAQIKKSSLR